MHALVVSLYSIYWYNIIINHLKFKLIELIEFDVEKERVNLKMMC